MTEEDWDNLLLLLDLEAENPAHAVGNPAYWREIRFHIEEQFVAPVTSDDCACRDTLA